MDKIPAKSVCRVCKERSAITTSKVLVSSKITSYIIVAATITDEYLLIPVCEGCDTRIFVAKLYRIISGILIFIFALVSIGAIVSIYQEPHKQNYLSDVVILTVGIIGFVAFIYFFIKTNSKFSELVSTVQTDNVKISDKFQISSESIIWMEKELLRLNQEIFGEERPVQNTQFFQPFPKAFLEKENLTTEDVAEASIQLVRQTRERIGNLKVPFRKPRVEFTSKLTRK